MSLPSALGGDESDGRRLASVLRRGPFQQCLLCRRCVAEGLLESECGVALLLGFRYELCPISTAPKRGWPQYVRATSV